MGGRKRLFGVKFPGAAGAAGTLGPRFRITRVFMLTGLAFLGPAWFSLVQAADALAQGRWLDPFLLSAVHLFVIGYSLTVVQGAMLQIVPVAFQGRLHSIRLGYLQYVLMVPGSLAFPVGFFAKRWDIVAAGGMLVLVAYSLLFWNLVQTARTLKKRTEALGIMTAFLFLLATVIMGIGMALGRPPAGQVTLPLHMVAGVTGWFTTLVVWLSPRLMSFFVSSRYPRLRRGGPGRLLFVGMLAVAAGMALRGGGTMTPVAMGILAGGWLLYLGGYLQVLIGIYRHFRERRRQEVEWVLKWILGGLYGGIGVLVLWAVVSSRFEKGWTLASGGFENSRTMSVMLLLIFGYLQWMIAAYMAKIMPFLRWMGRYGHGNPAGKTSGRRPALSEMMPQKPTVAALLGFAAGAVMLALGACFGRGALTLTGAVLGTVAWVFYVSAMSVMYRR